MHATPDVRVRQAPGDSAHDQPLGPLQALYDHIGAALPEICFIPGAEVPEPYAALLVHQRDMTPTLEAWHGETIRIEPLDRFVTGGSLCRMVVLILTGSGSPVEFGAIRIQLEAYPTAAREEILGCSIPLGTILRRHAIPHTSHPSAFFRLHADSTIAAALGVRAGTLLFGRCNALTNPDAGLLADVVEILPPSPARV